MYTTQSTHTLQIVVIDSIELMQTNLLPHVLWDELKICDDIRTPYSDSNINSPKNKQELNNFDKQEV